MSQNDKMGIGDSVSAVLGTVTEKPSDKNTARSNVHAVLTGPDGVVKVDEWGENLVTDVGDGSIAERLYDDAGLIVTGMKLGTGAVAADKNTAGHEMGAYISGSNEALDAAATDATKGAGAGWRTTYICTWIAGDVTNGAIAEVALTDQTALADNTSAAADTWARYVFASTIDKQSGDSLEVTWQIDILGA
jgi:hypothetical protein